MTLGEAIREAARWPSMPPDWSPEHCEVRGDLIIAMHPHKCGKWIKLAGVNDVPQSALDLRKSVWLATLFPAYDLAVLEVLGDAP